MLIAEIGRFGDNYEDLTPEDLRPVIPSNQQTGKIGIFWHVGDNMFIVYKTELFSDLAVVELGQEWDEDNNPDDLQIDYNLFHKDIWEEQIKQHFPEYADFKFDHFSRGRILYEVQHEHFTLFGPSKIMNNKVLLNFLVKEFNIPNNYVVDDHIYKNKSDIKTISNKDCLVIN